MDHVVIERVKSLFQFTIHFISIVLRILKCYILGARNATRSLNPVLFPPTSSPKCRSLEFKWSLSRSALPSALLRFYCHVFSFVWFLVVAADAPLSCFELKKNYFALFMFTVVLLVCGGVF